MNNTGRGRFWTARRIHYWLAATLAVPMVLEAVPAQQANKALPALESPSVPLHRLMRELHSGAYFLGKGPEILWSNVTGWVLVALSLTGLWLWRVTERAKAASRARRKLDQDHASTVG
ncbi:MAG: hypothetical protein H3C26_04415 [Rhodocyclaceae bacterium]|nr:hypothetical protein [Rhodocyclaceae bacterium]